jgi:titin
VTEYSAYTSVVNATTLGLPPLAPTNLTATPGAAGTKLINLAWVDNATTETAYYVERSTTGTTWSALATLASNVTTYQSKNLTIGTTYYYRVRAYSSTTGYSAYSNVASATAR